MRHKTYDIVYTGIFAVLLAICSWLSVPTVIPFTLQTFGVFLTVLVLGGKRGTTAILIYLMLGAVGIPVFSNFGAGLGYLLGNTGGYALGFVLISLIMWLGESFGKAKPWICLLFALLGLAACYAFGTLWFINISMSFTGTYGLTAVLSMCVFPFIIPDLCKLALAYAVSNRLKPILQIKF